MEIIEAIGAIIVRLLGISFGIGLIAVVLVWFGIIPTVAVIFQNISGLVYLGLTALMVLLLIGIVRYVIK